MCEWVLLAFDNDTDWLVNKWPLIGMELRTAQSLFQISPDNPMYNSYQVIQEHVAPLHNYTDIEFSMQKYSYFVERDAI